MIGELTQETAAIDKIRLRRLIRELDALRHDHHTTPERDELLSRQIAVAERSLMVPAIAIGTGPSVHEWLADGIIPAVPLFGCSWIPHRLKLACYCYGDSVHKMDLPGDGTPIVATSAVWRDGWELYDSDYPHAAGSGGMAISEVCKRFKVVGLIGFDDGSEEPHETNFRKLLEWWTLRRRRFVSLSGKSGYGGLIE